MYHGISSKDCIYPQDREVGAELYDVSVEQFRKQLQWLRTEGYTTVFNSLEAKKIVITFDDGEMSNFKEALPVLKEFGFQASFFIIVKRVGKKGYMGWKELKGLLKEGMSVGSHGLTHHILTNLLDSQVEEELEGSKRTLEINLNTSIDQLSIPRGFCNDKIIQMAYQSGYKQVYISDKPCHVQSACIPRVAIKRDWSLERFKLALESRWPWSELLTNLLKKVTKTLLKESGYNWVRALILRMVL